MSLNFGERVRDILIGTTNKERASSETRERLKNKGKDVEEYVVVVRHGDRTTDAKLTNWGRAQARGVGRRLIQQLHLDGRPFEIQAFGSQAGPKTPFTATAEKRGLALGRAAETAHVIAHTIGGENSKYKVLETEVEIPATKDTPGELSDVSFSLNFGTMITKAPYDHEEVYDRHLLQSVLAHETHTGLSENEKSAVVKAYDAVGEDKAARRKIIAEHIKTLNPNEQIDVNNEANGKTIQHVVDLPGEGAARYRREAAGAVAHLVNEFRYRAANRPRGTRRIDILGTHGITVDFLLQQALINDDGTVGLKDLKEIGGSFSTAEGWVVKVKRDQEGNEKELWVRFLAPERLPIDDATQNRFFRLDIDTVNKLAMEYEDLHARGSWPKETAKAESVEEAPKAETLMHFSRHGKKLLPNDITHLEDLGNPLTEAGWEESFAKGRRLTRLIGAQTAATGAERIRTKQTALATMAATHPLITGSERSIEEIELALGAPLDPSIRVWEDDRLTMPFEKGVTPGVDRLLAAADRNEYLPEMYKLHEEQMAAGEPKGSSIYAKQVRNMASLIARYARITPKLVENPNTPSSLERFPSSHGGVQESFWMELIRKTKGEADLTRLLSLIPNGVAYNEGMDVHIMAYDRDADPKIRIRFEAAGKEGSYTYDEVIPASLIREILAEFSPEAA